MQLGDDNNPLMSSSSATVGQTRARSSADWEGPARLEVDARIDRRDKSLLAGIYSKRGSLSPGGEEEKKRRVEG